MGDSSSYLHKILFAVAVIFSFVSCSQSMPELNFTASSVIFDYDNETDFPSARMAVFVDLSSDARRAESMKVESINTGYCWEADSLLKFENNDRKISGYTNFVMPNNELFPQGQYMVTYIDANDESCESTLYVSFQKEIAEMIAFDAASFLRSVGGIEYWAAYDSNEILLCFEQKGVDFTDSDSVWSAYRDATFAREVFMANGGRTMCIMPRIYKDIK